MFWNILILFLEILSVLYAYPYGYWEYTIPNKMGGIIVFFIASIGVLLGIAQLVFP